MASISKDPSGNRTIQYIGADGKRRSIRLGKVSAKTADSWKLRIEYLANAVASRLPLDPETATWLRDIGEVLAAKLAKVGLIPPRSSRKLGEFLEAYLEGRKHDSKPATVVTIHRVVDDLCKALGRDTDLRSIGPEQAEGFKAFYQGKQLAAATIHRRLKSARMFFDRARKLKLISENPFAEVQAKNANPPDRQHFISIADTEKLIAVSNPTWRTIIALARYGGLRCPSEVLMLRWDHVDFATNRMTVSSPKTEHHEGRAYRVVPIFGVLRQCLEDAYELAEPGEVYVVGGKQGDVYRSSAQGQGGWVGTNLRTTFEKIVRRAGLIQWPRLFQNLRSSRETELVQNHPIHVVAAWLGNTPKIAIGHYLQTLEADFDKAVRESGAESGAVSVQNAVQTASDRVGPETTNATGSLEIKASRRVMSDSVAYCTTEQLAKVGLEPTNREVLDFESSAYAIPPLGLVPTDYRRFHPGAREAR